MTMQDEIRQQATQAEELREARAHDSARQALHDAQTAARERTESFAAAGLTVAAAEAGTSRALPEPERRNGLLLKGVEAWLRSAGLRHLNGRTVHGPT